MKKSPKHPALKRKLTPKQLALLIAALTPPIEEMLPTFKLDDYVYQFGESFPCHPNTLFASKNNRLFLADVEEGKIDDLREVSLVEALEWYSHCIEFSREGSGSVELLCKLAAQRLK